MATTTEATVNVALAQVLERKNPRWRGAVGCEQTGVFERTHLRPDLVVSKDQPVIVETEIVPARSVEDDASGRLGEMLVSTGYEVEQVVAVRIPEVFRQLHQSLAKEIEHASFEYCVYSGTRLAPLRWSERGWIVGALTTLLDALKTLAYRKRRSRAA